MAIIENRVTEDGDVLIIKPETPIVGLISLYQFIDTTSNESLTDYFRKEFRYSVNGGLTFGEWVELSLLNIQGAEITMYDQFVIEYRYTRVGTTPDVELSFEDILVSGEITSLPYPTFDDTLFNDFFEINNINVFGWALNVLEKLYAKGLILPDYVQRADNNSNLEDEDFIVYWNSITHYFAIIVYFARQFENIESNSILLEEFIKNKDLTFLENGDPADLLFLYQHYVDEYRKRGTELIFSIKDDERIDGELLRLINYQSGDPLLFSKLQTYDLGWCIGKSSPCWSNTTNMTSLLDGVIARSCPLEDYEIVVRVSVSDPSDTLTVTYDPYDVSGNLLTFVNFNSGSNSNYFCENISFPIATTYTLRGVLWNWGKDRNFTSKTNILNCDNLQSLSNMSDFGFNVETTGGISVIELFSRPLKLNFSRGQLGMHNVIYMCYNNKNGSLDDQKIKDKISDELVSYNTFVKTKLF